MSAIKGVFNFLWDMLYFLTGEGSWMLRPHERIVLEAAITSFPDNVQKLIRTEMKQKMFIQRSNRQISRPRFYSTFYITNHKIIEDKEFSHKIVDIQICVDGEKQNAQVEFFEGRIDSIQFKKPGKFYVGKTIKVVGVKSGNVNLSHAAAIDRREHGRKEK